MLGFMRYLRPTTALPSFLIALAAFAQASPEQPAVPCVEGQVTTISHGEETSGCEIDDVADLDTFTFFGNAGDVVRFVATSQDFNPTFEFRDPLNNPLPGASCSCCDCVNKFQQILDETGSYVIRVFDTSFDQTGTYSLRLEILSPVVWGIGLRYDNSRFDRIEPRTDHDVLQFKGRAGTEIRLVILANEPPFRPLFELRDSSGQQVDAQGCGPNPCSFFRDVVLSSTGSYYLMMSDVLNRDSGDYRISLQCLFGDCPVGYYLKELAFETQSSVTWTPVSDLDASYDVIRGDLDVLRSSLGDFSAAVTECVSTGNTLPFVSSFDEPDPGNGFFYVVRAAHDEIGLGSYDTALSSQVSGQGGRDVGLLGIDSSPNACSQATINGTFVPDQASPGSNTVSMAEDMAAGDLVTIDVQVTDTAGIFGANFDVLFDSALASFVSWSPGTLLERGGVSAIYLVNEVAPGRLTIGATRQAAATTDAVGTVSLIRLSFQVTQIGVSIVEFDNQELLDGQRPPQPIAGISWFGGSLTAN